MLIAGIAIWLTLVLFFVALCRGAAAADGRGLAATESYPTATASLAGADGAGGRRRRKLRRAGDVGGSARGRAGAGRAGSAG